MTAVCSKATSVAALLILLMIATFLATSHAAGHGDCVEAPGFHCVTFVCSGGSGFYCLLQFPGELMNHNPNPKGKKNDHKWDTWKIPSDKNGKRLIADFVELKLGNTIQNLKVPHDMTLDMYSYFAGFGKHAGVKIDKSGEVVCSGGFLTPSCHLK